MSHKKFGPDRFSRFDVYWIQTNRQAKFIYRYMGTEIGVNPHGESFSLACTVYKIKMLTNFIISILQLSKYR